MTHKRDAVLFSLWGVVLVAILATLGMPSTFAQSKYYIETPANNAGTSALEQQQAERALLLRQQRQQGGGGPMIDPQRQQEQEWQNYTRERARAFNQSGIEKKNEARAKEREFNSQVNRSRREMNRARQDVYTGGALSKGSAF